MKLLNKTNRYYIMAALVVFLIGTLVFYVMLNQIMDNDANEQLLIEKEQISQQLDQLGTIPAKGISAGDRIDIILVTDTTCPSCKGFKHDTAIYVRESGEVLPFRQLSFLHTIRHQTEAPKSCRITITKALFEDDDLILTIVKSMLILLSLLLLTMFEINRRISKRLWKPFYSTLQKLEVFNISKDYSLQFQPSGIREFDELNTTLEKMTHKISEDYHSLKDFSENASHEIQTPLAVIKSKLELLIQSQNLEEKQMKLISDAYESASRLSRLNQALILLTRINNRQYLETKQIAIHELIENKLQHFDELIQHKQIVLTVALSQPIMAEMNPTLADVLISNLLGNAIKHNITGGWLRITSLGRELRIGNKGETLLSDPSKLFERFRKDHASAESLGLGLAIVKQICDFYSIIVSYEYSLQEHTLVLVFPLAQN